MSLENNMKETDYDQDLLAEKYNRLVGLSRDDFTDKRLLIASFCADNVIRLIKSGLSYIKYNIPVECALDIGCGGGHLCRVLIQEKITEYVVGIDKSEKMIKSATANSNDDNTQCKYIVANAATHDLLTIFDKKCPLIVQVNMLCYAEDVNHLSQILSNIAQVSCGVFVGLIPNPYCDYTSESVKKLLEHGVKYTIKEDENSRKDGTKYQVTFEPGTSNEFTLVDHWYSAEAYEKAFKQAGFKFFGWIPLQLNRNKDSAYLIDLVNSNSLIGFIAIMT